MRQAGFSGYPDVNVAGANAWFASNSEFGANPNPGNKFRYHPGDIQIWTGGGMEHCAVIGPDGTSLYAGSMSGFGMGQAQANGWSPSTNNGL